MNTTLQDFESLCAVASANLRVLSAEMAVMRALKQSANGTATMVTKKLTEEIIPEIELHDPVLAKAVRETLAYQLGLPAASTRSEPAPLRRTSTGTESAPLRRASTARL